MKKFQAALRVAHFLGLVRRGKGARKTAPSAARPEPRARARPTAVRKPAIIARREDDDVTEMEGNGPIASARCRERERCEAILTSPAAAANFALAKGLAFNSDMPRAEAIAFMRNQRSRGEVDPHATASSWDAAMANAAASGRPDNRRKAMSE